MGYPTPAPYQFIMPVQPSSSTETQSPTTEATDTYYTDLPEAPWSTTQSHPRQSEAMQEPASTGGIDSAAAASFFYYAVLGVVVTGIVISVPCWIYDGCITGKRNKELLKSPITRMKQFWNWLTCSETPTENDEELLNEGQEEGTEEQTSFFNKSFKMGEDAQSINMEE